MLSERWRRVSFSHRFVARKRWFLKRYAKNLASRRVSELSLLQLFKIYYVVLRSSDEKSVAQVLQGVAREPHRHRENAYFQGAHWLLLIEQEYE